MTKKGRRLVEDFLLPSLNDGRYGDLLKWVDRVNGHFSIRWSHKNAAKWTLDDTLVFQDWDKLKGRYRPEIKTYFMQAKQRFRAALYKLTTVQNLASPDKHVKHYRLILNANKRNEMEKKIEKLMLRKGTNQSSIQIPVICKNTFGRGTELVGKEDFLDESTSDMSSESPCSIKSEECEPVPEPVAYDQQDYDDYQCAIQRQRKQSCPNHYPQEVKTEKLPSESCVLRESPQINIVHKAHVLSQVVPVYSKSISRQTVENSPKSLEENCHNEQPAKVLKKQAMENTQLRVESPRIFHVPTYNTPQEIEIAKYLAEVQAERRKACDGGALNLSVKCDGSFFCR